jgi:superoxide dismutase
VPAEGEILPFFSLADETSLSSDALQQDFAPPSGDVLKYIEKDFGSLDALIKKFSAAAVGVQGSGWGVRQSSE